MQPSGPAPVLNRVSWTPLLLSKGHGEGRGGVVLPTEGRGSRWGTVGAREPRPLRGDFGHLISRNSFSPLQGGGQDGMALNASCICDLMLLQPGPHPHGFCTLRFSYCSWSRWTGAGYFHQELTARLWANHFISLSIGLSPGKWRTRVGKITLSLSSYGEDCRELRSPKVSGTWKRFNRHYSCGRDS